MKFKYLPEQFFTSTKLHVRFRDLDPLNHVNNAVYNTYFEEARVRFIREVPEFNESMNSGHSFVLVQISVNYIKPALFGDQLLVCSSVKSFGNSSITGVQAIFDANSKELKTVAETTGVWYNINSQKPVRLPAIKNKEQYIFTELNG